jgi:putative membrane protein (TIGR04086 family)
LITVPIFIVFALILTYTDFPEKFLTPAVMIATVISVLVAGSTATQNIRSGGWVNGGIVGAVYMMILYLASSIVFRNFNIDFQVITMFVIGILAGAIGGIMGINIKKPGHSKHKR